MSAQDNGGSAFPLPGYTAPNGEYRWPEMGMTLRDYFAAKALGALVGYMNRPLARKDELARHSYEMADAMLKARQQ